MNKLELQEKLNKIKNLAEDCLFFLNDFESDSKHLKPIASRSLNKKINLSSLSTDKLDYGQNSRVFFRNNVKTTMNGQKKFTLLVAYLANGKENQAVLKKDIEKLWKDVKIFVGGDCKNIYGTRAKDDEYLDSFKIGVYTLGKKWKNILN